MQLHDTTEAHNCVSTCTEAASEAYSAEAAELISLMTLKAASQKIPEAR